MQLVDSKLYIANVPSVSVTRREPFATRCDHLSPARAQHCRAPRPHYRNFISVFRGTSASARLLTLMVAALAVTASPALLATIRSTISLSLQILLQAGHLGLVAFQIFGR
jgi:hypothetical protein